MKKERCCRHWSMLERRFYDSYLRHKGEERRGEERKERRGEERRGEEDS